MQWTPTSVMKPSCTNSPANSWTFSSETQQQLVTVVHHLYINLTTPTQGAEKCTKKEKTKDKKMSDSFVSNAFRIPAVVSSPIHVSTSIVLWSVKTCWLMTDLVTDRLKEPRSFLSISFYNNILRKENIPYNNVPPLVKLWCILR